MTDRMVSAAITFVTAAVVGVTCALASGCTVGDSCRDDSDQPIACEPLPDVAELPDTPPAPETSGDVPDSPGDYVFGPDDLDGMADESVEVALADDPDTAVAFANTTGANNGSTVLDFGRTDTAERRKFLPIGKTAGARRYVVMRLTPQDLPNLHDGDRLRAAAEIQLTTRCDVGQVAPGCNYSPHVRLQLVLSGDAEGTDANAQNTQALSPVKSFDCSRDEHHCVKTIDFSDASTTLHGLNCIANSSCFVNLVAWAYNNDARSGGQDVLLLGANEGDFLQNHNIEQDRGRIMAVRERGAVHAELHETKHDVASGPLAMASNGDEHRIYSHTLNGGHTLKAGETYLVWAEVDASANGRSDLSVEMYLTKNRTDHNGGAIQDTSPKAISEHNGVNCTPNCVLHKVTAFSIDRDIAGPVYVNIAASTEVPGPGSATTTIHDTGFIKALKYSQ